MIPIQMSRITTNITGKMESITIEELPILEDSYSENKKC